MCISIMVTGLQRTLSQRDQRRPTAQTMAQSNTKTMGDDQMRILNLLNRASRHTNSKIGQWSQKSPIRSRQRNDENTPLTRLASHGQDIGGVTTRTDQNSNVASTCQGHKLFSKDTLIAGIV